MIKKIAVVGTGTMGRGIAETFAMHGFQVNLYGRGEKQLTTAINSILADLTLLAEEGLITVDDIQATIDRITPGMDLREAVQDRDYVIESIAEEIEIKQNLFKQLDEYCPEHTILASNTSSLALNSMMETVSEQRKKQMMVNHWYNPGTLMPIVELSFFGNMSQELYEEVEKLYDALKKQTVKVLKDVPGLVANRIQQAVAREVFSIIEKGIAAPEDVDKALKFGPAFRYATTGQLEVADFGGLDIWCIVGDNLLKDIDNSQCANPLLRQKVEEGKLGIKSGEGFYQYAQSEIPEITKNFKKRLIHQLKASEYYVSK